MGELYFNEKRWRALGLEDQEIYYLRELSTRTGGSGSVSVNLTEVYNTVSNIGQSVTILKAENDRLRHRIQELENAQ